MNTTNKNDIDEDFVRDLYLSAVNDGRNSTYKELEEATERRIFKPVREGKRIRIPNPGGGGFWSND